MLKKLKITARNADKYKLYEEAVQNVDFEVDFYASMFKKYSKRQCNILEKIFQHQRKYLKNG